MGLITQNLVSAYDLNDTSASYKGKHTVNYAPTDLGNWTLEGGGRIATDEYLDGIRVYKCRTSTGQSWIAINTTPANLRTDAGASGTVTMSCLVRNTGLPANVYAYMGHDFSSTRVIYKSDEWQKISWTVNVSSMNSDYCEIRPYTNSDYEYLYITKPQIEINVTAPTEFVDGTRTTSQSILDIGGPNTIQTFNDPYDDNRVRFDGTNTHLRVQGLSVPVNAHTVTLWIKPESVLNAITGSSTGRVTPLKGNGHWNPGIWLGSNKIRSHAKTQYRDNTIDIQDTNWHQIGQWYDGNEVRNILDGEILSGGSPYGYTPGTPSEILVGAEGTGGSSTNFTGQIDKLLIYDRPLTASEIMHNYLFQRNNLI